MLDMETKLNKRERYKAQMRPFDYYPELKSLDFENLAEGDRFYLQDFGIFTTDFLEDEFTMRLRIPAGRVSSRQFSHIADIATKHDLQMILTARAGIQLHGLEADNVLEIFKQLNTLGLTTWQSFGDNIRNIVTDVYDGRGKYSEIEVYPIIMQMQEHILKNPRYVGMLPRRVSIGISGNSANVSSFFANDLYFALAKKEDTFGFNVHLGGKNNKVAQDADIFLKRDEVIDFFKAFVEAFYLHGSRFSRSKTRLYYLLENIGMEAFKEHVRTHYGKRFENAGSLLLDKVPFTKSETLKDGSHSFRYETDFARLDAVEIKTIADLSTRHDAEIRIGIDQNLYLLGFKETEVPFNSPKESATVLACAGNLCPYSFWSIKNETAYLPLTKISEHRIQVGFSGCTKGCGRHLHSDIGLIGLKTNDFGDTEGGARVFIGAEHSDGTSVGRLLFSMVPLLHLNTLLSLIITLYERSGHKDFEEYSRDVLNRFSEEFLAIWFLADLQTSQTLDLPPNKSIRLDSDDRFDFEHALLEEYFSGSDFLARVHKDFKDAISTLSKKLWTIEGEDPHYRPPIKRHNMR